VADRSDHNPHLILPVGTQVVTLRKILASNGQVLHPPGTVGIVQRAPVDLQHSYRVRFLDGFEEPLRREELVILSQYKAGLIGDNDFTLQRHDLFGRTIYRCVIGSRAYGLETEDSDTDYRGVYLPPADLHWSLYGVPDQLTRDETQEQYWELQRFLVLALKANPNVLECLYTPLVESITPLGEELIAMRGAFLSRMVYQTFNGYVASQFKKMQTDLRNQGQVKWKHVMHLLRLLISGIGVLRTGHLQVRVEEHRERLLQVKLGVVPWEETEAWRRQLHLEFEQAVTQSTLPERPDYEQANALLIKARRAALEEKLP
jgi:uncharacterized protein